MNKNDKYRKIPLTASIAEGVIIELFAGKAPISGRDIIREVTAHYTSHGGLAPKEDPLVLCKEALDSLKESGRAENLHGGYWAKNLHGGYWKILPITDDSSEEVLFSDTEAKAESIDDLVEGLLAVIQAEINNLDEEIEALEQRKSHLEENLTQFNRMWQNLSRKGERP
jgi:hypothetical protein